MKFNLLKVVFKAVWHALLALAMDFFCYVTYRQTHFASCILLKILVLHRNEAVWSHYVVGCYQQESRKTFCFTHAYHLTFPTSWSHGATLVLSPEPSQNWVVRIPFSEWLKGQHWKIFRLHQNFQCATGKCFLVFFWHGCLCRRPDITYVSVRCRKSWPQGDCFSCRAQWLPTSLPVRGHASSARLPGLFPFRI